MVWLSVALLAMLLCGVAMSTMAQAQDSAALEPQSFDIPAQPLTEALIQFGRQAGLQASTDPRLVLNLRSTPVAGVMTWQQALGTLLVGTGLTYRLNGSLVTLERAVAEPESGPLRLGDITVTARRTEELVKDVPGSVFVLPSEELEKSNITDLEDFALRTPNLNISDTGSRITNGISIRGISNITGQRASSPTVGVYVDEVMLNPTGATTAIDPNLFDLERAEVAYGPQGTAFGRGTIGGAINYVTKKPTESFEAELEGEVGSHPDGLVRGVVNGSLTGDRTLMARLVAFGRYDDGFIETPNLSNDSVDNHDYGGRLSLRSQPTDRLTLDLAGSFDRTEFSASNIATIDSVDGGGDFEFLINRDGDNRVDRGLISFRGAYDFDVGTLISNTSYIDIKADVDQDFDFTELDLLFGTSKNKQTSVSQEFRFEAEPFPIPLLGESSFLLGVNGTWAEEESESVLTAGEDGLLLGLTPGNQNFVGPSSEDVFDAGVFGEFRLRPIEDLELAVGGRFSYIEVDASEEGFESVSKTFTAVTPKASILYDWTEDFSTYALVSTGFKSGGFNQLGDGPLDGREFDNETAINYEGGFKSSWFDDRLFVNASGFALFYDDIQVASLVSDPLPGRIVQNAGSARSLGSELEVTALPLEGLQLNVAYGFTDAQFTDFEDAPGGDATGEQLPNAPRHTLSTVGEYAHPVFDNFGDAYFRVEYSFTSSFTSTPDVDARVFDSFDVFNFRLGLRADRFDIEAFVENAFNEKYATGATGGGVIANFFGVAEPVEVGTGRRFGVRARVRF